MFDGPGLSRRSFLYQASLGLRMAAAMAILSVAGVLPGAGTSAHAASRPSPADGTTRGIFKDWRNDRLRRILDMYERDDYLTPADAVFISRCDIESCGYGGALGREGMLSGSRDYGGDTYLVNGNYRLTNTWGDEYAYGGTVQGGSPTATCGLITTCYGVMAYARAGSAGYRVIYRDVQSHSLGGAPWLTNEYRGMFFGACDAATILCWAEFAVSGEDRPGGSITVYG